MIVRRWREPTIETACRHTLGSKLFKWKTSLNGHHQKSWRNIIAWDRLDTINLVVSVNFLPFLNWKLELIAAVVICE